MELPPATGRLPARELLPKPNYGNTEWHLVEDRNADGIPAIPGKNGGGFYSAHARWPESEPQSFIYEADLSGTEYELSDSISIRTGHYFTILEHNMVEVVWDLSHYD